MPRPAGSGESSDPAARLWTLRSLDPEVSLEIAGQYPAEASERRPSRLDTVDTAGPQAPAVLSAGTGVRSISVKTEFRALDYSQDIGPTLDKFRAIRDPDPNLGRHVRVRLELPGLTIEGKASDVELEIGTAWVTGLPRYFRVSFSVIEDGAGVEIETEAPTVHETIHVTTVRFETYEHLAARYLGDPGKGPLIRHINPDVTPDQEAEGGVQVRIFEREHPEMRRPVRPRSLYLGAREDFAPAYATRLRELAEARAAGGARSLLDLLALDEISQDLAELLT